MNCEYEAKIRKLDIFPFPQIVVVKMKVVPACRQRRQGQSALIESVNFGEKTSENLDGIICFLERDNSSLINLINFKIKKTKPKKGVCICCF
jgi:hypothetical protein